MPLYVGVCESGIFPQKSASFLLVTVAYFQALNQKYQLQISILCGACTQIIFLLLLIFFSFSSFSAKLSIPPPSTGGYLSSWWSGNTAPPTDYLKVR